MQASEQSAIVLLAGEGEAIGRSHGFRSTGTPARTVNLHAPGGFAEYLRELDELRAAGIEPDEAFFERHDVYGPE